MRTLTLALSVLTLSTTAHAARVTVDVLHPAAIDVPTAVRRVAVLDRSAARNVGQALVGTLEGAVTGEGIQGDREAARDAVRTMIAQLQASPRFEVVMLDVSRKQSRSSLWDKGLDASIVKDLCARTCDGIVSLEAFDSDNSADAVGVRTSRAVATWRFYDARSGAVIDDDRQHAGTYGPSVRQPLVDMVLGNEQVSRIGEASALNYAARIAPTWQLERRKLFGSSRGLKVGVRHAKASDWDGAVEAWTDVARSASARRQGKARYNLAVAAEARGDIAAAMALSDQALDALGNRTARKLSMRLRQRSGDALRLEQQLAGR